MKYYVVADVHGFYSELITALTAQGFFSDNSPHKLVVCGDLFDRGKEATKLQEFIDDLLKKDEVILIRGNHEDLTIEFVQNIDRWITKTVERTHHWRNGTVETVLQLTGMTLGEAIAAPDRCAIKMENTPFFKRIIPAMVNYFETEQYIFVHGWIPCHTLRYPGGMTYFLLDETWRDASEKDWDSARWYNGMEAAKQGVKEPGKTIVCGHWHCSYGHASIQGKGDESGPFADYSPYYNEGIIAIDACTVISRKVNCIVLEE